MEWLIKGNVIAGVAETLHRQGLFDTVVQAVPHATARLLRTPPPRTEWVRMLEMAEVDAVLLSRFGEVELKKFMRAAALVGPVRTLMPLLSGLFRLFGATPNSVMERVLPAMNQQVRGLSYSFRKVAPTCGQLTISWEGTHEPSAPMLMSFAGTLSAMFDLCNLPAGRVDGPTVQKHPTRTDTTFELIW